MNFSDDNSTADQALVGRVLRGDAAAFTIIIQNTQALVAQIVSKMIARQEDRQDMAQDIYIKVFKGLPQFRFQSKLSTWVAQIAYNSCLNFLEKKRLILHSQNDPEDRFIDLPDQNYQNSYTDMERLLHQKDRAEILKLELAKLPPLYQTLLALYHNEEMPYAEIAAITGLPEGTLKNYLFRARRLLRNNLLANYNRDEL